jgi:acyl carrier protein
MHPILNHFYQFLSKNFFISEAFIKPWRHLRSDIGLNSIEFLELIVFVENTYGIQITDEDLENIHTVENLTNYLESKLVTFPSLV